MCLAVEVAPDSGAPSNELEAFVFWCVGSGRVTGLEVVPGYGGSSIAGGW